MELFMPGHSINEYIDDEYWYYCEGLDKKEVTLPGIG
jgi:hypothetical protein